MKLVQVLFLAAATFLASPVDAQSPEPAKPQDGEVEDVNEAGFSGLIDLSIASSRKTASGEIRYEIPKRGFWALKLTGPFDDADKTVLLGDLDRFGDAASAEFAYERAWPAPGYKLRLGARAGKPVFKFLDLATNLVTTSREEASELFVRAEYFADANEGLRFALGLKRGKAFEAASMRSICTPVPGSTATECRNLATVGPQRVDTSIALGEIRYQTSMNLGFGVAVARDFESNITGIELPVYLERDSDSGLLSGGIKLSWQSADDDIQCLLFLSQPIGGE